LTTLKRRREYKLVYERGMVLPGRSVVLYALRRQGAGRRFGFVVGRKVGKAVRRNRVRRLLKEICRTRESMFPGGYDYVIVARAGACGRAFGELLAELGQLLGRMVAGRADR
jgi:ribonuclease P protein component